MMDQIHAKQVIDVVDKTTDQEISGRKTFTQPTNFQSQGTQSLLIDNGILYFVQDANVLDQEGNIRLMTSNEKLYLQKYSNGSWVKLRLS